MEIITNPSVPFWEHIPGGIYPGTVIKIDGHIPHHFERFAINLMCGHEMGHHAEHHNTIALHFNPRHDGHYVVLNTRHHSDWGEEVRKDHHDEHHAFHRGHNFGLSIHVEQEYYRINLNGNHFANFYHRVPPYEVKSLLIEGDVQINLIEYKREDVGSYMPVFIVQE
jgi:hypothetical protein